MTFYSMIRELEEMTHMRFPEKIIVSKKSIVEKTYPEQYILYEKHLDVRRLSDLVVTRTSSLSYLIVIPRPLIPPPITIEEASQQGDKYKEIKGENKTNKTKKIDTCKDAKKMFFILNSLVIKCLQSIQE